MSFLFSVISYVQNLKKRAACYYRKKVHIKTKETILSVKGISFYERALLIIYEVNSNFSK